MKTLFALHAFGLVLAFLPVTANADAANKVHRVGILLQTTPATASHLTVAFTQRLRELGHVEGKDVVFEYRWAEGKPERLPALAAELVRLKMDLILAPSTEAAEVARRATATIPIVMVNTADPVESGLVKSLARPGGNVTGLSAQTTAEIRAKQLQLLKEAVPGLGRVAILRRAETATAPVWKEYEVAGRALELKVQFFDVRAMDDLERAFIAMARDRAGALIVPGDPLLFAQRRRIVALASEHRLPNMASTTEFTDVGGLMAYSARLAQQFRRAAGYVDKILKGASPATLPVEQPSQFQLVVNLKAAKALRLTIPQALLVRADEVIQ